MTDILERWLACSCSWMGKGVSKAVENVNKVLGPAVVVGLPGAKRLLSV